MDCLSRLSLNPGILWQCVLVQHEKFFPLSASSLPAVAAQSTLAPGGTTIQSILNLKPYFLW